jgi:hypothetical protein
MSIDFAIAAYRNVIKKEAEMILKFKDLTLEIQRMWNVKSSDTGNNRGNRNRRKFTLTIPEQHTAKARNRGNTETSHIWHCTQTVGSANVKVQNIFHWRNNITCNRNCK